MNEVLSHVVRASGSAECLRLLTLANFNLL
jgi:hypothetical protein